MAKQCPQCRKIVDATSEKCQGCGLHFRAAHKHAPGLVVLCMRIAGGAFVLALAVVGILRLT